MTLRGAASNGHYERRRGRPQWLRVHCAVVYTLGVLREVAPVDNIRPLFSYTPCMASEGDHRVYMSFQDRHGWHCQFLEADLQTALPRKLVFKSPGKIIELVERGGGFKDQESRLMLEQGIAMGRGGVFLSLTDQQYAKLKR